MLSRNLCVLLVLCCLPAPSAIANDSTAQIGAGGLVLARTNAIAMESEVLRVSVEQISVDYVFRNRTDRDITSIVAFPLPDLTMNEDGDVAIPLEDKGANFVGFKTEVDGKPVTMRVEQRAMAAGLDQTAALKERGIPLENFAPGVVNRLTALDANTQEAFARLGLIRFERYDIGQGMQRYSRPNWTLKTTFYWEQTFPAGKAVRVTHRYQPAAGAFAGTNVGTDYFDAELRQIYERDYCVTDKFLADVKAATKKGDGGGNVYLLEHWVDYILKTGGNWAGGEIGEFRLIVDTGKSGGFVSLCHADLKPTGKGKFEWVKKDFWPEHDLKFLFVLKHKAD